MSTQVQTRRIWSKYVMILSLMIISCVYCIENPSGESLLLSPLKAQRSFNDTSQVFYFQLQLFPIFAARITVVVKVIGL